MSTATAIHPPAITLPDGGKFPSVGLGMWKMPKPELPSLVQEAIRIGYRHLDCACDYGNEPQVGEGIAAALRDGLCRRDDLWVTSKLWNTYHEPKHVRAACERSLRDLKLNILDLYLVHFPIALAFVPFDLRYPPEWFFDPNAAQPAMKPIDVPYADTWGAMEELQRAGLVKRIGVCNLNISMLRDLLARCSIRPAPPLPRDRPEATPPSTRGRAASIPGTGSPARARARVPPSPATAHGARPRTRRSRGGAARCHGAPPASRRQGRNRRGGNW